MREIKLVESKVLTEAWTKSSDIIQLLPNWFIDDYYTRNVNPDALTDGSAEKFKKTIPDILDTKINWKDVLNDDWEDLLKGQGLEHFTQTEMDAFIELFLQKWFVKKGIQLGDWEKAKNMLIRIIREVGVDERTNPFLSFVEKYNERNKKGLSSEDLITVNNAYANEILDYQDVSGTGHAGNKHIIFNPSLYDRSGDEQDKLVEIYEQLSDDNYLSKLNLNMIANAFPDTQFKALSKTKSKDKIRNLLMFEDGNPDNDVLSLQDIQGGLQAGLGYKYNKDETKDGRDKREKDSKLKNISKSELKRIFRDLDSEDVVDVINSLIKSGYVNYNDLKRS